MNAFATTAGPADTVKLTSPNANPIPAKLLVQSATIQSATSEPISATAPPVSMEPTAKLTSKFAILPLAETTPLVTAE